MKILFKQGFNLGPLDQQASTKYAELQILLTLVLLNPDMPCLCKQCRFRSVGFFSGSALFAIQYWNLYQQSGSSNLNG